MTLQFKKQVRMNTTIAADITEALASHMNAKGLAFVEATENDLYSPEPEPELGTPVYNAEPRWLIMRHKQTMRNPELYSPLHLITEWTSQVTYNKMQKYLSKFPTWTIHGEEYNVVFIRESFWCPSLRRC